jgi:hypothetical protein
MAVTAYRITNIVTSPEEWVPVIAPIACQTFMVNNIGGSDDLLVTHDPADTVSTRILVGNQWSLLMSTGAARLGDLWSYRFRAGDTVTYIKSTVTTPRTVEVTFI